MCVHVYVDGVVGCHARVAGCHLKYGLRHIDEEIPYHRASAFAIVAVHEPQCAIAVSRERERVALLQPAAPHAGFVACRAAPCRRRGHTFLMLWSGI